MMTYGYGFAIRFAQDTRKYIVAQFAACHLYRLAGRLPAGLHIEVKAPERYGKAAAQVLSTTCITVTLFAAQVIIAV